MAASLARNLLKKPLPSSPLRILASLNKPQLTSPQLSPFLHQNPDTNPSPNPVPIFPSFPYCFSLDPVYIHGIDRSDGDMSSGDGNGEGAMIWADSVKKKRKRKMNKHKLKKLRKRLRRKA